MKPVIICYLTIILLTIGACGVSKKSSQKTIATEHATPVTNAPHIAPSVASSDGIFAPGNAELTALQQTDKQVTMQTLVEGHKLYTGVCTNCHRPKSIYDRPERVWPGILTSMAKEANITDAQKDAIYKYVLAIKATQPRNFVPWAK